MDNREIKVLIIENGESDHVPHEELIKLLESFFVILFQFANEEWFVYFSASLGKAEISNICKKIKVKCNLNETKEYFEGSYAGKPRAIKQCLKRQEIYYKIYQKPKTEQKGLKMEASNDIVRPASNGLVFKDTGIAGILKDVEIESASDEPSDTPHILHGTDFSHPDLELARQVLDDSFRQRCSDIQIRNIVLDIPD